MYIPLSEPGAIYEHSGGEVVSHLILPNGVDTERIELNISRLARMGRLAASNQLHLSTVSGEQTNYDVDITSMQADGTALLSGGVRRHKKPLANFSYDDANNPIRHGLLDISELDDSVRARKMLQACKTSLGIFIDKSAVEESLKDGGDRYAQGIIDAKGWAKHINTGIKQGVQNASLWRYGTPLGWAAYESGFDLLLKLLVVNDLSNGHPFFPLAYTALGGLRRLSQINQITTNEAPLSDYNWSFFNDFRIDRLIAAKTYTRLGRVARYRA